jgi:hypothetical protein
MTNGRKAQDKVFYMITLFLTQGIYAQVKLSTASPAPTAPPPVAEVTIEKLMPLWNKKGAAPNASVMAAPSGGAGCSRCLMQD